MEIRPFRGWRYAATDVSALIAPPYDILDAADKAALLGRSADNIVAVDMPHVPPNEPGPAGEYEAAAATLAEWNASGRMVQDPRPALYVYQQTYTRAGKTYCRRAILAGVRATDFGKDVIPHEHTFAGPMADRLKLTECTGMQLSPIFGFYNDPAGQVGNALARPAAGEPAASGTLAGVQEKLWILDDPKALAAIAAALKNEPVFIADGHHRYTTAMNYAKSLRRAGRIDHDHETNFVMFALVARTDPGLLILPTHRLVAGLKADFTFAKLRNALGAAFDSRKLDPAKVDLSDADAALRPYGPATIAVIDGNEIWTLKLIDPAAMQAVAPNECDAWRALDVAILQELVIDRALSPWKTGDFAVTYTPDGAKALSAVRSGRARLAFCLQGTSLSAIETIALAGATMPHKSTYFYPKLATGMVLKPLQ
jgi:uncharacterized protein (DUF1015 family)